MEKVTFVDQIEVVANGAVQVRTRTNVVENGVVIGSSLHRHVVNPGDDYSGENAHVKAICKATHTASVIATYKAATTAQGV
jgi:hypothetical protein